MFGKKPDLGERVRGWKRALQRDVRQLERQIREIDNEEKKVIMEMKKLAKKGDTTNCKVLAKQVAMARRGKERLYSARAQIHGVQMQLQEQLAQIRVTKALGRSAQIMQGMNSLVRLPQLQKTMMVMAREMEKAGLIEEVVSDTLDMDEEGLDAEADEEVDKVMMDLVGDVLGQTAGVAPSALPAKAAAQKTSAGSSAQRTAVQQ